MFIPAMEVSCAEARHNNNATTNEHITSEYNQTLATKNLPRTTKGKLPGDTPEERMPTKKEERLVSDSKN
jgi:hypothetical protein